MLKQLENHSENSTLILTTTQTASVPIETLRPESAIEQEKETIALAQLRRELVRNTEELLRSKFKRRTQSQG
jgi:hypothetical protein